MPGFLRCSKFSCGFHAGVPTFLLFAAGVLAGAMSIIGIEVINTIHYILNTMIHDRDFWEINDGLVDGLFHYSVGSEGRIALNYWLWIGLTFAMFRIFIAVSSNRRDLGAAFTVLAAGFIAYAIPTLSERQIVLPWSDVLWRVHCGDDAEFRRSRRWSRRRNFASDAKTGIATLAQVGTSPHPARRRAIAVHRHQLPGVGHTFD